MRIPPADSRSATLLLLAAVAMVYATGLGNGFLWIDHAEITAGTVRIHELADLPAALLRAENGAGYHRPLYRVMHTLDHALWGDRPAGYYLSSLLLHVLNTALLLALLRRCGVAAAPALATAGLWALHPVNSAVAGLIHAKADLLGLALGLACALAFVRVRDAVRAGDPRSAWRATALGAIALAGSLLSKELAFLLPVGLALWILDAKHRGLWRHWSVLAAVAVALAVLHAVATAGLEVRPPALPLGERLLTFAGVYLQYLGLLELPIELSLRDTVTRFGALGRGEQVASVAGLLLVVAVQAWLAWRSRTLRPWIVLGNLALLPVAQLVPLLHFRADRYLYVPSLAFAGFAVALLGVVRARLPQPRTSPFAVAAACVLLLFAARTVVRLHDFRDDVTLFEREVRLTPDYLEGLAHLGRAREVRGDLRGAEACYRRCLEPPPGRVSYVDRDAVLVNLSGNLLAQARSQEAFDLATAHASSVRAPSHRAELDYNSAVAAFNLGRHRIALELLSAYVAARPGDAIALYLCGRAAHEVGERATAERTLRAFLALDHPDRERRAIAERILGELR